MLSRTQVDFFFLLCHPQMMITLLPSPFQAAPLLLHFLASNAVRGIQPRRGKLSPNSSCFSHRKGRVTLSKGLLLNGVPLGRIVSHSHPKLLVKRMMANIIYPSCWREKSPPMNALEGYHPSNIKFCQKKKNQEKWLWFRPQKVPLSFLSSTSKCFCIYSPSFLSFLSPSMFFLYYLNTEVIQLHFRTWPCLPYLRRFFCPSHSQWSPNHMQLPSTPFVRIRDLKPLLLSQGTPDWKMQELIQILLGGARARMGRWGPRASFILS